MARGAADGKIMPADIHSRRWQMVPACRTINAPPPYPPETSIAKKGGCQGVLFDEQKCIEIRIYLGASSVDAVIAAILSIQLSAASLLINSMASSATAEFCTGMVI